MGAIYDDWVENAPNGVGWDDWLSGEYLKPDYWERKRYGSSYKSTEEKLNDANKTINQLREENEKLHKQIGTLEAEKDHYKMIADVYEAPKRKSYYKKRRRYKFNTKFNGSNDSN